MTNLSRKVFRKNELHQKTFSSVEYKITNHDLYFVKLQPNGVCVSLSNPPIQ